MKIGLFHLFKLSSNSLPKPSRGRYFPVGESTQRPQRGERISIFLSPLWNPTHFKKRQRMGPAPSFDEPPDYGSNLMDGNRINYGSFGLIRNFKEVLYN